LRIETFLSAAEAEDGQFANVTVVVIDVIRATSTIVQALSAGARAVYPTLSSEEAIRLANSLGREDTLLCGERRGFMIDGFDLGNSPAEFTPDSVSGRRVVLTTTNGTRAFRAAEAADRVIVAALMNLSAAADALLGSDRVAFICAGKEGHLSLDDAVCAGLIIGSLTGREGSSQMDIHLDDASQSALTMAAAYTVDAEFLRRTAAGMALVDIGLEADVDRCAEVDCHRLVPEMCDRMIRLPEGG
jgi:2-phosphosulfolactate phosphatase